MHVFTDANALAENGLTKKQYRMLVVSGWVTTALSLVGAYTVGKGIGKTAMKIRMK